MKKILTLAIVAAMMLTFALSASAAETTLPDVDSPDWWAVHTQGFEVTEEGLTFTFHAKSYISCAGPWDGAYYTLYTANEPSVPAWTDKDANGHVNYWIGRCDGQAMADGAALNTWEHMAQLNEKGITVTTTPLEDFIATDNAMMAYALTNGVDATVTAKLVDGKVIADFTIFGQKVTSVVPVDTSKPVYIDLFGQKCVLSNITLSTPDAAPDAPDAPSKTGDVVSVLVGMIAVSAVGGAVIIGKKKRF